MIPKDHVEQTSNLQKTHSDVRQESILKNKVVLACTYFTITSKFTPSFALCTHNSSLIIRFWNS